MNRDLLERLIVRPTQSLQDALAAIEAGTAGAVLVADDNNTLKGILTDGDMRRSLLKGVTLKDPISSICRTECFKVDPSARRVDVLDLMRAHQIQQVPIVDQDGRVVGLHLLREVIQKVERPNWAVVMAGGQGKRLRPYTGNIPKPMLEVAGRPILERVVLQLIGAGIRKIFLSVNYLSHVVEDHFRDGSTLGCEIEYLHETEPMGSGGALSLLPDMPASPVIVMNGDLVTDFSPGKMLDFHSSHEYLATIGLRVYQHEIPYGCVTLEGSQVMGLREKPIVQETINAGVYVVSPELIARVPKRFFPITDLFEQSIGSGEGLGGYLFEGEWIDVGQPSELLRAQNGG